MLGTEILIHANDNVWLGRGKCAGVMQVKIKYQIPDVIVTLTNALVVNKLTNALLNKLNVYFPSKEYT